MRGILNGMVMQRNKQNVCEIYVSELVYSAQYSGPVCGTLTVEETSRGTRLTGMPAGGPYRVQINGEEFTDIYVGDLWMLAGQSNMEGCGLMTQYDHEMLPDPEIRAFYMEGDWRPARHGLCEPYRSVYQVHVKLYPEGVIKGNRCVGPGISFGNEMKRYTGGVPQGLIIAAHGGTSMSQWSPELKRLGTDESLYAAMLDRFERNGSHLRGMFWYQGCSDTAPEDSAKFTERMLDFVQAVRADMGQQLPIVQVQIGPVHHIFREFENSWNSVRMQQYELTERIPYFDTITAVNKDLTDYIHLSSGAQRQIGKEAAESMAHLLWPERTDLLAAPRMKDVWIDTEIDPEFRTVCVSFENLHGFLKSEGRAWGFALTNTPEIVDEDSVITVRLKGDTALIRTELSVEELEKRYLYYGWGQTVYFNLTDEAGRAVPAFGPIALAK